MNLAGPAVALIVIAGLDPAIPPDTDVYGDDPDQAGDRLA